MAWLESVCVFARKTYTLRKLLASSLLVLTTCVIVIFWTGSYLSFGNLSYILKHSNTTAKFLTVIESLDSPIQGLSTDDKLLLAVNKLPFRVMTPSSLLLEDLYFIPSTLTLVHYSNVALRQPQVSCSESDFLLILVPSHPESVTERQAIRETWGTVARGRVWPWKGNSYPVKLLFVLGVTDTRPLHERFRSSEMNDNNVYDERGILLSSFPDGNKQEIFSQKDNERFSKSFKRKVHSLYERNVFEHNKRSGNFHNIRINKDTRRIVKRQESGHVIWSNPNISGEHLDKLATDEKERNYNMLSQTPDQRSSTAETPPNIFRTKYDLISEISSFDDILQFDMIDSYTNLTRKIILSLLWSVKSCSAAKFLLKVDPDVFVNIPLLTTFLKHYGEANSIYGHIYPNSWVERRGKWAVSSIALPIPRYPIYAAGNAYILSKDTAEKIIKLAPHFPYILVEDAFITGILASVGGVDRVNVGGFTKWTESKPDPCDFVRDRKYVGNNFTEYDHRILWREIIDNGNDMCVK